jgi:signal peptidase I
VPPTDADDTPPEQATVPGDAVDGTPPSGPGPGPDGGGADPLTPGPAENPEPATLGDPDGAGGVATLVDQEEGKPGTGRPAARHRWIIETAAIVVVAVLVALVLRTFVVQTYFIPSGSMEPTLQIGDRILVDKLSYHLHGVQRGDIVVFARPKDEDCGGTPVNDLVKRVIGLPGETISAVDGHVDINGKTLKEPWLPFGTPTESVDTGEPYDLTAPYKIPPGYYYVMGDNRTESCDSRYWGPIPKSLIVGKVVMRIWPVSSIRFF